MRGRKPADPALTVIQGDFNQSAEIVEPKWTMAFPSGAWGKRAAQLAKEQWEVVTAHMRGAGTLGPENVTEIEVYCTNYARWRLAEANVAENGPIVPAPKTGVPMHNPYLSVANAAADKVMKVAADLGLPPSMRGRVTRSNAQKKRQSAAAEYLGRKPA